MGVKLVCEESGDRASLVDEEGFSRGYFMLIDGEYVFYEHLFVEGGLWVDSRHSHHRCISEGVKTITNIIKLQESN
jgi:hypothetical protein